MDGAQRELQAHLKSLLANFVFILDRLDPDALATDEEVLQQPGGGG